MARGENSRAAAVALLEFGLAAPAVVAAAQAAFNPAHALEARAVTQTTSPNCTLSSHRYASIRARYSSKQTSITSPDIARGVGGAGGFVRVPAHHTNAATTGANFVDQETWLETGGNFFVETGMVQGYGPGYSGSRFEFFLGSFKKVKIGNNFYSVSNSTSYSGMSKVPDLAASYNFRVGLVTASASKNSQFVFSLIQSPFHASKKKTYQQTEKSEPSGPYYELHVGTETSCDSSVLHNDNWWNPCSGSSDGCNGAQGPNYLGTEEKVYNPSSKAWVWNLSWEPSDPHAWQGGVPYYIGLDTSFAGKLHYELLGTGNILEEWWSGMHI